MKPTSRFVSAWALTVTICSITALFTPAAAQAGSLYFNGSAYGRAINDLFGGGYSWPFTMEAWVKTTNHTQDRGAILNKEGFWTETRLYYSGGQIASFYATDSPNQHYEGPPAGGPLGNNLWTHIALVGDGSSLKLYKNGQFVAEDTSVTGGPKWSSNPSADNRLKMGKMIWGGSPLYFTGWIGGVRVSNVARYAAPFTPLAGWDTDANTELLLKLNEGAGNIAYDSSGKGHNFELFNTQWSSDMPVPEPATLLLLALATLTLRRRAA